MDWLRRTGRVTPLETTAQPESKPDQTEGAAPGVAVMLGELSEDRSHAIVDLGPATGESLGVYSRYARWVRFADVLGEAWRPREQRSVAGLLQQIPANPQRPYDFVFAWDILDRLFAGDRPRLVEWVADVTAPGARLHVLVRTSENAPMQPLRFSLLGTDRLRFEPTSPARLPPSKLLPADVAKLLAPLQVVNAFTLKTGFREYVAVRR